LAHDGAGNDFALALRELLDERVALVFAELLDHDLLRGLRGNAAELLNRDHLATAIGQVAPDREGAAQAVHFAAELLGVERVEMLTRSTHHGQFEISDEMLAVDVAVARDGIEESERFGSHRFWPVGLSERSGASPAGMSPRPARQFGCHADD
jgi:hypothetical protein